jgi:hypothetical protein
MSCTTRATRKDNGTLVVHGEPTCPHGFTVEKWRWVRGELSEDELARVSSDVHQAIQKAGMRCEDDHAEQARAATVSGTLP